MDVEFVSEVVDKVLRRDFTMSANNWSAIVRFPGSDLRVEIAYDPEYAESDDTGYIVAVSAPGFEVEVVGEDLEALLREAVEEFNSAIKEEIAALTACLI